ncbi:type VII secretion protein EccE [Streptomyces sp. NPDC054841]
MSGTALALLRRTLLPSLTIRSVGTVERSVGIADDGHGWSVAIAVDSGEHGTLAEQHSPVIPLDLLEQLLEQPQESRCPGQHTVEPVAAAASARLTSVQILTCTPSATADVSGPPGVPAGSAFRRPAPVRHSWLVLRLEPFTAQLRGAVSGPGGAAHALRKRARWTVERLTERGLQARVLSAEQYWEALALAAGSAERTGGRPGTRTQNSTGSRTSGMRHNSWHNAGLIHRTYAVNRWAEGALSALDLPQTGAALSVTLTGRPGRGVIAHTLLRTSGPASDERPTAAVISAARRLGAQLTPLRGAQLPGTLATLPFGRTFPLRAGWPRGHRLSNLASAPPALPVGGTDLLVGTGPKSEPVAIPLARATAAEPLRAALLCGSGTAATLLATALGSGMRVRITSVRPDAWAALKERAPRQVIVAAPGQNGPAPDPRLWLRLDDGGSLGRGSTPGGASAGSGYAAAFDLLAPSAVDLGTDWSCYRSVLTARLARPTARALVAAFGMGPEQAERIPALPEGVVAVIDRHGVRYARTHPTR